MMRLRDRRHRCRSTPFRAWMDPRWRSYRTHRPYRDPPRSRWRWATRARDNEIPF